MDFHQMITERLDKIRDHLNEEPDIVADKMMRGRFERIKCSYGTTSTSTIPTIPLLVPGLGLGHYNSEAKIEESTLIVTRFVIPRLGMSHVVSNLRGTEKNWGVCLTRKLTACSC